MSIKTSDFGEDTELLSLVEPRPIFWDKTNDIYRQKKKGWTEMHIGLKEYLNH